MEFFEFYRSLRAYAQSLGQDGDTTMVLSPNSQFFRFFGNARGEGIPAPATGAPATPPAGGVPGPAAQNTLVPVE
jgi:membrane protease subunit HflC